MPETDFAADFKEKILFGGVTEEDVKILETPSGINLAKLAANWSDGIILGSENISEELVQYCKDSGLPLMEYNAEALQNGSYVEDYNSFYDNL
jgi:starch synthase